jgi:N-acetylglucosaminyldiphosphoundecaprenol N-acetyl-beta-D-mannosaminyltransferase
MHLMGLPVWSGGREGLRQRLIREADHDQAPISGLHSINAEICVQARGNSNFRRLLTENPINLADGEWIRKFVGLKYGQKFERISGSDYVSDLCVIAEQQGWSVFLLGASDNVSKRAAQILGERHPDLELHRYSPPYDKHNTDPERVPDQISDEIQRRIQSTRPHVLIACLGTPKQELWFQENESALHQAGVRVFMGAGGSLDFIAGEVKRAPKLVSTLGVEWLWRLAQQPSRLRRMASRLPRFFALGLMDAVAGRLSDKGSQA